MLPKKERKIVWKPGLPLAQKPLFSNEHYLLSMYVGRSFSLADQPNVPSSISELEVAL